MQLDHLRANSRVVAEQDGPRNLFVNQDLTRAEDLALLTLWKDHPPWLALGLSYHDSHYSLRGSQAPLQLILIRVDIQLDAGYAGCRGRAHATADASQTRTRGSN